MKTEYNYLVETFLNKTENYLLCEPQKTPLADTVIKNLRDLYKYGRKEYGRCVSKMYVDSKDGITKHVGYVFEQKRYYEDTKEPYIAETWLSLEHYIETVEREYIEVTK